MKKMILTISLVMGGSIGAMEQELSQEFKQYLFDNQLPAGHKWQQKTVSDRNVQIREEGSAKIVMAKRMAIEKVIKADNLTKVTLVKGYVRFHTDSIKVASDITAETSYDVLQAEPCHNRDIKCYKDEAEEITTLLKRINMSADDIFMDESIGACLKPGKDLKHFVESWPDFWFDRYGCCKFEDDAREAMEKTREYLQAYVLKCHENYTWDNPKTEIADKFAIKLPLSPEPDEVPIEGQVPIKSLLFAATSYKELFRTVQQRAAFWQQYDEHRAQVQGWLNKDFFK